MFQILLDHFFRHLPNSGAEIAPCPKVSSPITLFQVRKLFEQIARGSSFDPSHDLARRQIRRRTDQNMHVVFAHHTSDNPNLKRFTGLANHFPNPLRNLAPENLITLFGYPNKMILNLENRMTPVSVIHLTPPCALFSQLKLTG
jgi:hypothetical protein